MALNSLADSVYENLNDSDLATFIIKLGLSLNVDSLQKSTFILSLRRYKYPFKLNTSPSSKNENSNIGYLLFWVCIIFIIVGVIIVNNNPSKNSPNNSTNNIALDSTPVATIDTTAKVDINSTPQTNENNTSTSSTIDPVYKSPYISVNMKNGNIKCPNVQPVYDYEINTRLIISASMTDVAVKLFEYSSDNCIRYVFVRDGTTFTIKNIPEGRYYIKIAYGYDWTTYNDEPLCKGHFNSSASYKKSNDIYDFTKKTYEDGRVDIPYYRLKLYRRYSSDNTESSTQSNTISPNDFNN